MTRFQTVSWVEPAKSNEQSIGRFRSLLRCALDFDTIFLLHSLPGFNVRWMTLHPSTNVLHATSHNPTPWCKTLRGFPPYGCGIALRYHP
jgi:hypothetical protein